MSVTPLYHYCTRRASTYLTKLAKSVEMRWLKFAPYRAIIGFPKNKAVKKKWLLAVDPRPRACRTE